MVRRRSVRLLIVAVSAYILSYSSDIALTQAQTPSAQASGAIINPLQIVDENEHVVTGSQTTVVGKVLSLEARVTPANLTVRQYKWTIAGNPLYGSIIQDRSTGQATPLPESNKTYRMISFCWIAEALATARLDVKIEATVADATGAEKIYSATLQYEVLRPTATLTATTTPCDPPIDIRNGKLTFGDILAVGKEGIAWHATVTTTQGEAGQIAFLQLVNTVRATTMDDQAASTHILTSGNQYVLDDKLGDDRPGGFLYLKKGGGRSVDAGDSQTAAVDSSDTPSQSVDATIKAASADDKFILYLVYRPAGQFSIWVPLRKLEWYWRGSATKGAQGWNMDAGQSSSAIPPGQPPTSVDTTEMPAWQGQVTTLPESP